MPSDNEVAVEQLRLQISREARRQGSYSHNIIMLALQQIDGIAGRAEANKAIDDMGLLRLGWSYQTCEHCGHWPCGCGG